MSSRKTRIAVACTTHAWLTIAATAAFGHGNPVHVEMFDDAIIVSGGLNMTQGFVNQSWDSHEDAALDFASGNRLTSMYPGYEVSSTEPSAPLQLEVISRPDYSVPGNPNRWLWYWSASANVTSVPGNARFDIIPLFNAGGGVVQMQQSALVVGPSTTMANQIGPFMNTHAHLLSYELRNSPVAQPGVYAFFARLTSPGLEPSEPFLLAFRNQLSIDFFEEAVTDINQAAMPLGDFNADGRIDAADYAAWRKTLGGDEEYAIWRENFGSIVSGAGGSANAANDAAAPEPASLLSAICIVALIATRRSRSEIGRRRISREWTTSVRTSPVQ